jgi:hypothetical protein
VGAETPEGWERDSETLYLHPSGVRIERRLYRQKEGWFLIPADLDRPVMEFAPDEAGLAQAFAAFSGGALEPKGPGLTKRVQEARDAARRDEKPDDPSEDEDPDEDEP